MDIQQSIDQLRRSGAAIVDMVGGVDAEHARWKPAPERWSILEVINHLADEEREDFRTRFELTLRDPHAEWPKLDPEAIVVTRAYNARELAASLDAFRREREQSLAWMASLGDVQLDNAHAHPAFGALRAGDLLAAWVAHDLLHIRQIARIQYEYVAAQSAPYSTAYAGPNF
jgi:hypothetical protein